MRLLPLFSLSLAALLGTLSFARADKPQRTWNYLTTGNGHGFQVYDSSRNKLTHFLDHPYRYLGPTPGAPMSDGVGRRNLAYDFYFGVRGPGGSGWLNDGTASEPEYVEQTNVIHVPIALAGVNADAYYFAPFGYEGNALIALLKAPAATDLFALFNFHMGGGTPDTPDANGESLRMGSAGGPIVVETGPGGGAMVYIPLSGLTHADCTDVYNKVKGGSNLGDNSACSGNDMVPAFQAAPQDGWLAVAVLFVEDPAQAETAAMALRTFLSGRKPPEILDAALKEWDAWRKPPAAAVALCTDDEKRLWRQSEAVLRMGQIREPYTATRKNYGMVLASLPIGEWHTGWVRDAMYAISALARMGHTAEARMALEFFLNAGPVGKYKSFVRNQSYRISVVRYFGNGEEEADYSGQTSPNVEIDGWGLFLWAVRQYVESSGDTAWLDSKLKDGTTVWDTLNSGVAQPLIANLEPSGIAKADSSIWEVHDANRKHYAYTSITAIRGFCDLAAVAKKSGRATDATTFAGIAKKGHDGFFSVFLDQNGAIAGSTEELGANMYLDAAVVEAFTMNILTEAEYGGRTSEATFNLLEQLRIESGGFKRNDDGLSSYDNNEWILIDLRMSDALWRAGGQREQSSKNLLQIVIDKASANFYLLPELYNAVRADGAVGKYAGSIPMVGYGGGAYILTMLDRSSLVEPNDCGDGAGNKMSGRAFMCATDSSPDGGTGNSDTPSADQVPYTDACLCRFASPTSHASALFWLSLCSLLAAAALRRNRRRA